MSFSRELEIAFYLRLRVTITLDDIHFHLNDVPFDSAQGDDTFGDNDCYLIDVPFECLRVTISFIIAILLFLICPSTPLRVTISFGDNDSYLIDGPFDFAEGDDFDG